MGAKWTYPSWLRTGPDRGHADAHQALPHGRRVEQRPAQVAHVREGLSRVGRLCAGRTALALVDHAAQAHDGHVERVHRDARRPAPRRPPARRGPWARAGRACPGFAALLVHQAALRELGHDAADGAPIEPRERHELGARPGTREVDLAQHGAEVVAPDGLRVRAWRHRRVPGRDLSFLPTNVSGTCNKHAVVSIPVGGTGFAGRVQRVGHLVAGVDSSTQSTTVVVIDAATGVRVATGKAPHVVTGTDGARETDPELWWAALRDALAATGHASSIAAISVAAQQHGLVVLDADGRPLRPAVLWNDTRSGPQTARLVALLGRETWATRMGTVPVPSITVTRWVWLRETEPEVAAATRFIRLPHDFLTERLCGRGVTDRGDASGTGWWSTATGAYDEGILGMAEVGLDRGMLPEVLPSDGVAGTVTDAAAAFLGIPVGIRWGPALATTRELRWVSGSPRHTGGEPGHVGRRVRGERRATRGPERHRGRLRRRIWALPAPHRDLELHTGRGPGRGLAGARPGGSRTQRWRGGAAMARWRADAGPARCPGGRSAWP